MYIYYLPCYSEQPLRIQTLLFAHFFINACRFLPHVQMQRLDSQDTLSCHPTPQGCCKSRPSILPAYSFLPLPITVTSL